MLEELLITSKNTLILTISITLMQYIFAIVLFYFYRNIRMYWWAIPSSTGVILLKLTFGHFVIINEMFTIFVLSTFFGIPFAYNCIQSSFEEMEDVSDIADSDVGKILKYLMIELPIAFGLLINSIMISFISTWFKINIIIPYNNGGLLYDTSNIDTLIFFEAISSFDYPLGLKLSLLSIVLCLCFAFLFWRCLIGINNNNYIYKFSMWCYNNLSLCNYFRDDNKKNKKPKD